jgi:cell shape-determining protein MreC
MRYSRNSNRVSFSAGLLALAAAVLVLFVFLFRLFFPGAFFALVSPLWSLGNQASAGLSGAGDADGALLQENAELKNENEALKARLKDVGALEGIPTEAGILAGVLARPPVSPYDTLVLAKGTDAGISLGDIVFAEGVPVGRVVEAASGSSRARLYSSTGERTEGWLGEERVPVTLLGEGAGTFSATVARELIASEGDIVYFPGPGAFPAGVVRKVKRDAASPSASLSIEPLVNPFSLTYVRVLP